MVSLLRANHPEMNERELFEKAREQTRFHYQWLVVNDFLIQICGREAVQDALRASGMFDNRAPFMPLEFSTAVYRFGHSMVRNEYDFNLNFGRGPSPDYKSCRLCIVVCFYWKRSHQ